MDSFDVTYPIVDITESDKPLLTNRLTYIIDFPDTNKCMLCGDKKVGISKDIFVVWICHVCYKDLANKLVKTKCVNGVTVMDHTDLNDHIRMIAMAII